MPSSVSGRLISGSWTVARAALMASSAGEPVRVSDIVCVCLLRRGTRSGGGGLDLLDRVTCHCTAGNGSGGPAEGDPERTRAALASPECPPPSAPGAARRRRAGPRGGPLRGGLRGGGRRGRARRLAASTLSLLMFTGASQFALVGVLGAGGSALAAVGTRCCWAPATPSTASASCRCCGPGEAAPAGDGALGHRRDDGAVDRRPRPGDGPAGVPRRRRLDLRGLERHHGARRARCGALGRPAQAALDAVVPAAFLALLWPRLQ